MAQLMITLRSLIKSIAREHPKGKFRLTPQDIDPLIDVIMRFSKAVADGVAQENLCLLAQVIAGLKKNKALADR